MLSFDKATYLSLLFRVILSVGLSNSLWGSDVLIFSEFINIVSILFYNFIEFIILLLITLYISFARYREYIICMSSFSKFPDVLPAFSCASAIDNLWSICLDVSILKSLPYFALYLASDSKRISNFFSLKSFELKSFESLWIFCITLIWYFDFDFLFPFFILLALDLKLIRSFNTYFGFILPSLKSLNNSTGF